LYDEELGDREGHDHSKGTTPLLALSTATTKPAAAAEAPAPTLYEVESPPDLGRQRALVPHHDDGARADPERAESYRRTGQHANHGAEQQSPDMLAQQVMELKSLVAKLGYAQEHAQLEREHQHKERDLHNKWHV
jgi:hypothetical protein